MYVTYKLPEKKSRDKILWLKIRQAKKAVFKGHSVCLERIMKFLEQKG